MLKSLLLFLALLGFAQEARASACQTKLHELNAQPSHLFSPASEVTWRKLEPYLASVQETRPFDFNEVNPEPVLGERVLVLCLGNLLLVNADTRYLRTIDVKRQEQLSAVKVLRCARQGLADGP